MSRRYHVHPAKCIIAAITCLVSAAVCLTLAACGRAVQALPFGAIAALFLWVGLLYGSRITIDPRGVHRRTACLPARTLPWNEIAEVGVVGLKVFNNNDPQRTGTRYIYFSPRPLSEAERFRLALEWPPRHMPYLSFSKERLNAVQQLWNAPIETYNAGDVFY